MLIETSKVQSAFITIAKARGAIVILLGKWTRRPDFKSWTKLLTFYIALIPIGKVSIQLFSLTSYG